MFRNFFLVFLFLSKLSLAENFKKNLNFNIQFSNFSIAKVNIEIKERDNIFLFNMNTNSIGVLEQFYKYKSNVNGHSLNKNGKIIPKKYKVKSNYKNKTIKSEVIWNNTSDEVLVYNEPELDLKKVKGIPRDSIKNVIDPFSSFLNILNKLKTNNSCLNQVRVFDGRRRYDVKSKELSRKFLKKDRPNTFQGNVIICGFKFYPIGGHRIKSNWRPENDKYSDIKVFFGFQNNLLLPVRMEIQRWFGKIISRMII